ncbi:MAG TPA: YcgN family cysteine cluster protein [Hellea balneolensis]|uniref:UPF0260 protein ENK01_03745 n=1 Tax=Hellea balneolensis TaxID=287478 RepID=A0A7V5NXM5_9PROT|nr:YcgN family cysteine cluster protein [Hellea balneolensis]
MTDTPFWKTKTLEQMSEQEWESLCDGCGKCCLLRMEDEDDASVIYVTDIHCKLFDPHTCRCRDYPARQKYVPDCVRLTPENVRRLAWIPQTCAYRLIAEGKDLPAWHHLISGSRETIHQAGMSVRDATVHELDVDEDDMAARITLWPGEPDVLGGDGKT